MRLLLNVRNKNCCLLKSVVYVAAFKDRPGGATERTPRTSDCNENPQECLKKFAKIDWMQCTGDRRSKRHGSGIRCVRLILTSARRIIRSERSAPSSSEPQLACAKEAPLRKRERGESGMAPWRHPRNLARTYTPPADSSSTFFVEKEH
jgi:hypothetical protein